MYSKKPRRAGRRQQTNRLTRRAALRRRSGAGPSSRRSVAVWALPGAITLIVLGALSVWFASAEDTGSVRPVAVRLVYTAPTANDAATSLPEPVRDRLRTIGWERRQVEVTRIEHDGSVSTTVVDMTPRAGDAPSAPVLKVDDRARAALDKKIAGIETAMNSAASSGGRALYVGLTRLSDDKVPVIIISSGLDLSDPADFRKLAWRTPVGRVVEEVRAAGALPTLHGEVTFVVVASAGAQTHLGPAQKQYQERLWRSLLTAGGASSVTFVSSAGSEASSTMPAPTVIVPSMPTTPIPSVVSSIDPRSATCTVPASYFVVNTARLVDASRVARDLDPCVTVAMSAGAVFKLDGWTSYDGPLTIGGRPAIDSASNRRLSNQT